MRNGFEYISDATSERLAILENRAAELGRRLGESAPARGVPQYSAEEFGTTEFLAFDPPPDEMFDVPLDDRGGFPGSAGYRGYAGHDRSARHRGGLFGEAGAGRRRRGYVPGPGHGTGGYFADAE